MKWITTTLTILFSMGSLAFAQGPQVVIPTKQSRTKHPYPWKKNITATIFWIGETPTPKNPTPNHASSWDTKWQTNFGGFDDPNNRATIGYRPAKFIPKLNPFYIALPFNDRVNHKYIKPETSRMIKWFSLNKVRNGKSCCKGRWLQIVHGRRYCFAQWEDCGPFNTTDHNYVFGNSRPKNPHNNNAGIDISPAIRDYLGVKSGQRVHWRFVEAHQVPPGPWKKYGQASKKAQAKDRLTKIQREMAELRRKRDENFRKNNKNY